MAILVDDAIWPWRGLRWAHLVSDSSLDELHDFAHRLGMPYLAFQGDHYDVHAGLRELAITAGARAVPGREIVGALRDAGLRRRGGLDPWRWHQRVDAGRVAPDLVGSLHPMLRDEVVAAIERLRDATTGVELALAARAGERLIVVSSPDAIEVAAGLHRLDEATSVHRSSGERGTFLEWVTRA
jgi:hypothetical protein